MSHQPGPSQPREIHQHRRMAESFGADAERYDRTRPPYPDALISRVIAASPGRDILDVGCGTGIEARQFKAAGCTVTGVEPDARMAEWARRTGVEVEVSTLEAWDPAGRDFDAVIAGTAWHWVDPVVGAAKAAQVLRPGGLLAPFHHVFQTPPEVADALATVYRQVVPDSPVDLSGQSARPAVTMYEPLFTRIADGMRETAVFTEPERWRFEWECTYTTDQWLDQIPTHGLLTGLDPGELAKVQAGVGAAIDAMGGSFTMPYTTVAVAAFRTSGPS